jgi:hypothetical protein
VTTPPSWPEKAYGEAAKDVGRTCGVMLLTEERWVHRRVETIDLLSTELVRRTTSVDFTVPAPLRPLLVVAGSQPVVPIATLSKSPLRNFDLRDEGGRAIPVLGRDQNGDVAHNALLAAAESAVKRAGRGPLAARTIADLRAVAIGDPDEAEATASAMVRAGDEGDEEMKVLFADDRTVFLLSVLAYNYVLLAALADLGVRRVLKFGYDEPLEDSRALLQRLSQGLGATSLTFSIDVPGAGRATSYHAEIVIPEELRIEEAVLYDLDDLSVYGSPDVNADRGALYTSHLDASARPALFIRLRAERSGLPTMAFSVGLVTASLLGLGAIIFEPDPQTAGPPVSVLLAASALFAGAVAQRSEHNLVKRFFVPLARSSS